MPPRKRSKPLEGAPPVDDLAAPRIPRRPPASDETERVTVFTLVDVDDDGNEADVEYTVPARQQPHLMLQYLYDLTKYGRNAAAALLTERALGPAAFAALVSAEGMTSQMWTDVNRVVARVVLGKAETSPSSGS